MLGAIYGATLAPGITFWDAGEFITAVHTFGIPHPPGTPLYVLLARSWRELVAPVAPSTAVATNLFSAACTALAAGALAWLVARSTGERLAALGAALTAGAMSTVWLNANESEVYAAALLLAMALLVCAERAGSASAGSSRRWTMLTAYVMVLAVPLHLSALAAAPAALVLASQDAGESEARRWRWQRGALLTGVFVVALGAGLASRVIALCGGAIVAAALFGATRGERFGATWRVIAAVVLALSVLAVLPLRAAHDPALNAGDPVSWSALWDVVGRRQYGAHGLWPRQAPLWAQLANFFEYADWQVALGLGPGVAPSWSRTPITLVFAALGAYGAIMHRRIDRRSWRACVVLAVCTSLGLVLYLNFKAGASFGYGVLPDQVPHEVRDRDYFFALAFWTWGAWAGLGAVLLARRHSPRAAWLGLLVAALPIALNWRAVDRRRSPAAGTASALANALLWSAPRGSVLVTGGDNDSFPLWYAQIVEHSRPDVTVVTGPLLGAAWYRAQLARRDSLLSPRDVEAPVSELVILARVADRARARGRPLAVAITAGTVRRDALGAGVEAETGLEAEAEARWTLHGLVYVESGAQSAAWIAGLDVPVDTLAARAFVERFGRGWQGAGLESVDPAPGTMTKLLGCPARMLQAARSGLRVDSLDSDCKWR
jgi:hypothetical protein